MSTQTIRRPSAVLSQTLRERYKREIAAAKAEMGGQLVVPAARGKGEPTVVIPRRRLAYLAQFDRPEVRPDAGILNRRIRRMERALANGSPDSLSPGAKQALEKEAGDLKGWLAGRMVPQTHSSIGYGHPDFQKAVKQAVNECSPEFQKRAGRYKSIMREIAPEDPDAANLERIRPKNA